VGCLNRTVAKQQEALIKTDLMKGRMPSDHDRPTVFKEWALEYIELESVKRLKSYRDRARIIKQQLIPCFGSTLLTEIRPRDIERYRAERLKEDGNLPALQTVNNDHIVLKHCLNIAIRQGLLISNPATKVPVPNPHNERDRILSEDEWMRLYEAAASHLRPILLVAYHLGQRLGEILNLTWDRVDLQQGFITLRAIDTKTKKPRQVAVTPAVR
jgi:integrase